MRDLGLRLDQAARDGGTHAGDGRGLVGLDRALAAVGAAGAAGFSGGEDVGATDAATGAGAFHAGEVDALFLSELPGEGGNLEAGAVDDRSRIGALGLRRGGGLGVGLLFRLFRFVGLFLVFGVVGALFLRLFRLGRGLFLGRGFDGFAFLADGAEGFADRDLFAFAGEDLDEGAVEEAFELHRGFVGLDLGEHVAGDDLVALLLQPFDQRAHRHGVAEFRHFDDVGHGVCRG